MTTHATQVISARPNIEQYRKQARELLQALRSQQPDAVKRLRSTAPHIDIAGARLADAQFVIAREHGFPSWPKFKQHIEQSNVTVGERAAAFVEAATSPRLADAKRLLAENPGLADTDLFTAVVYGNASTVARLLDASPESIGKAGGPRNRLPLVYLALSRFIRERENEVLSTARLLLDRGANPNSTYMDGEWTLPVLYGACGQLGNAPLASMLIDAGSKLDDHESLYHSVEFRDHACTRLLLERGARANGTNTLKHMLDFDDREGLELLLEHGADPNDPNQNGETALHWALFRHRGLPFVSRLVEAGVDVNARRNDGLSAFQLAARLDKREIMAFLRSAGADTSLTEEDNAVIAAVSGSESPRVVGNIYLGRVLADAAEAGNDDIVRRLLDAGVDPDSRGSSDGTALHLASWNGHVEVVRLLIDRGATVTIEGANLGSTPLQWAIHASTNNPYVGQETWIAIVDALMSAGAVPMGMEFASDEVRAYIE